MRTLLILLVTLAAATSAVAQRETFHHLGAGRQVVSRLGDIDGDGHADVLIGAPEWSPAPGGELTGAVVVRSGATGATLLQWSGMNAGDYFGAAVACAGDFDADGFTDVVIGAPQGAPLSFAVGFGYARVYSGNGGALLFHRAGPQWGAHLGDSVGGGLDVDRDGYDDPLFGAPRDNAPGVVGIQSGVVRIYSGYDGTILRSYYGKAQGDYFGFSISVQDDSFFVVGAPQVFGGGAGYAEVYGGYYGTLFQSWSGAFAGERFGWSVAYAGDWQAGSGVWRAIIGAPGPTDGSRPGRVIVANYAVGSTVIELTGAFAGAQLGYAVDGASDVDGDGLPDLMVGAPGFLAASANERGAIHVFSGADGAPLWSVNGADPTAQLGASVVRAGDVDLDGLGDVLVASDGDAGEVFAYADCASAQTSTGKGCAGAGGFVPRLAVDGCVGPGVIVDLTVTEGLGGAFGIVLFGTSVANLSFPDGCALRVDPATSAFPFVLAGVGPGAGAVALPMPLPSVVPTLHVAMQAFVADPSAHRGFSMSNGFHVATP